jgi:hypothetical protein
MKKLVIIFLLSFAFLGSANAVSIKGAFGFKLGQVVEDATGSHCIGCIDKYNLSKTFVPQKPLPGDFSYYLYATPKDKKVYTIYAIDSSSHDSHDDCSAKQGDFNNIMKIFELKYGFFSKTNTEEKYALGHKWKSLNNSYVNGHREILIRCRSSNSNQHRITITYIDYILEKIQNEEAETALKKELKEREQKFIEDAADYDI